MDPETTEVTTVVVTPEPNDEGTEAETLAEVLDDAHAETVNLDHESRITAIEIQLATLAESVAAFAQTTTTAVDEAVAVAEVAIDIANDAADIATDAMTEAEAEPEIVIEPEPEPEAEPDLQMPESARVHPWFRPRNEWGTQR